MTSASEGSARLDKTLASKGLADKDGVSLTVKRHLLKSSFSRDEGKSNVKDMLLGGKQLDELSQHWCGKVWSFLEELRSASLKHTGKLVHHGSVSSGSLRDWKLKDESDRHRVMYCEGPVGTPYHTLCIDGVIDGDFTSALCVGWESPMYKEWWPQFQIPTFKITESKWLRRIRVGEDLSLLRFKVPWPLAQREVLMSAFEVEYFEEDLIIVLIESVPEDEEINENIYGYNSNDLPLPSTNVRMEIGGGFVMQRASKNQFFFRTIMNLDMKVDFVPPWMINFISRQLAEQGLKLYQKAVLAVSNGTGIGKAFEEVLKTGQLYERMRSNLAVKTIANGDSFTTNLLIERLPPFKESGKTKTLQGSIRRMGSSENYRVVPYPVKGDETDESSVVESGTSSDMDPIQPQVERPPLAPQAKVVEVVKPDVGSSKQVHFRNKLTPNEDEVREYEDPEVEWALGVLDKMILFSRSCDGHDSASDFLNSQAESTSSSNTRPDLTVSLVNNNRKSLLPPVKNQSCNIVLVKPSPSKVTQKLDTREPSRLSSGHIADLNPKNSDTAGFCSNSEIEIVSSQDDIDIGESARIVDQPRISVLEVQSKRRRRRWRWTCFSPSSKSGRVRSNIYSGDNISGVISGRASDGHWRSMLGDSNRFSSHRGYVTDGDEKSDRIHGSRGYSSPDRFVTLGELLMNDNFR